MRKSSKNSMNVVCLCLLFLVLVVSGCNCWDISEGESESDGGHTIWRIKNSKDTSIYDVEEAGADISDMSDMSDACTPNCKDKECGDDGCGGSCGNNSVCSSNKCVCNIGYANCNKDLSEQQLVSCSPDGDCRGGLPNLALRYIKDFGGIVEESCLNYQSLSCGSSSCASSCSCNQRCAKPCTCDLCSDYKSRMYNFESYQMISNEWPDPIGEPYIKVNFDNIKRAIVCNGPLSVASVNWLHAIVLVGYDDEKRNWVIRNSWGPNWEENGYKKIPYTGHSYSDLVIYTVAVKNVKKVS